MDTVNEKKMMDEAKALVSTLIKALKADPANPILAANLRSACAPGTMLISEAKAALQYQQYMKKRKPIVFFEDDRLEVLEGRNVLLQEENNQWREMVSKDLKTNKQ